MSGAKFAAYIYSTDVFFIFNFPHSGSKYYSARYRFETDNLSTMSITMEPNPNLNLLGGY